MRSKVLISIISALIFAAVSTSGKAQQAANVILAQPDDEGQIIFDQYFETRTLRVDYLLGGDANSETAFFVRMKEEPNYGGPKKNLTDPFGYGSYRYVAFDSASGRKIFSRGFNSLYQEWRGTPEAKTMHRAYPMTTVMPFPKNTIRFLIEKRSFQTDEFEPIFDRFINPADYFILRESVSPVKVTMIREQGEPSEKVDVAFIAEGYTTVEMEKFIRDAQRMAEYFLSMQPYDELADRFNFYALEAPSHESGVTIPGSDVWVNTNCRSSFYTFDMDRYLTSSETHTMYDIAANVPYDMIFILVNSKRYGGGGFYNHYGQSTVDHEQSEIVALHEFGHQFAGLADEYYTSEVTYSDFYNVKFEPWEPNITTNVDFKSKWAYLITPGVPIPTPREDQYQPAVGMFEGGGYLSKGIFSPMMDCRMKSNGAPGFCPACQEAIRKMIRFYSE